MGGFHYFPKSPIPAGPSHAVGDNTSSMPLLQNSNDTNASTNIGASRVHPLDQIEVISMINSGKITLPTEAEIKDRSKSDWIAKSLVLLQTTWFITQCIARQIEHLPTTELEIVTLAYTALNFGIFVAWWDKPQLVDCPVRVSEPPARAGRKIERDLFDVTVGFAMEGPDTTIDLHNERMVPRFYGGDIKDQNYFLADGITLLVGVVFGAIHCLAWSFEFQSHTETFLWRMSSVSTTCVPVLLSLSAVVVWAENVYLGLLGVFNLLFIPLYGALYIAARLTTLILAFMNLSSAPPGVFQAVHWTTLILHL